MQNKKSGHMRGVFHWLSYPHCIVYQVSALLLTIFLNVVSPLSMAIQRCVSLHSTEQEELFLLHGDRIVIRQHHASSVAGMDFRSVTVYIFLLL